MEVYSRSERGSRGVLPSMVGLFGLCDCGARPGVRRNFGRVCRVQCGYIGESDVIEWVDRGYLTIIMMMAVVSIYVKLTTYRIQRKE